MLEPVKTGLKAPKFLEMTIRGSTGTNYSSEDKD
jgi:hypothetical protein